MNSWLMVGSVLAFISVLTAEQDLVSTHAQELSDAQQSQGEGFDRSIIGTVINITNSTNATGAAVQQMIEATSAANTTSTNAQSRINWGELCRKQLVDPLIAEPCETLTTPDGYTLTTEGQRVFLVCIGGGALATMLGYPELTASFGNLARCGESTSQSDNDTIVNMLKNLIGNYTD